MACVNGACVDRDDAGTDGGRDAGEDAAAPDTGTDDTGPADAGSDAGSDAGDDAGADAGPASCLGMRRPPILLYRFDDPDPSVVSDSAPLAPNIDLAATGFTISGGAAQVVTGSAASTLEEGETLAARLVDTGAFTVEAWVLPRDLVVEEPIGPERMVTLSAHQGRRAFTFGLRDEQLVGRLSTSTTEDNGTNCILSEPLPDGGFLGPNVELLGPRFRTSGDAVQVVVAFRNGRVPELYMDGVQVMIDYECEPGDLNWELLNLRFVLGDEAQLDGMRQYEGRYDRVALYDRYMNSSEVACWFAEGPDHPVVE